MGAEVWDSNLEPIKFPTCCQRLTTAAALICEPWRKTAELGTLTGNWARDTRKGIKRVQQRFDFFIKLKVRKNGRKSSCRIKTALKN